MRAWICVVVLVVALPLSSPAEELRVSTRDELIRALSKAKPGTEILIAAGRYDGGISQAGLTGSENGSIVIRGADQDHPPEFEGGPYGFHFSSPRYVTLKDLVIAKANGNGLNVDDGGSVTTPAKHVNLERVTVRDVGPRGNRDGIKLSGVDHFSLRSCRVERWGSSGSAVDMVGCHHGMIWGCQFLEAGGDAANGVQTKGGSSEIEIRRCRFDNCGGRGVNVGGSTGLNFFRPARADAEARDITVADCQFLGGQAAVAFVGVDGAIVERCTIYRPKRWVGRILQENTDPRFFPCRDGRFRSNVIVFHSSEIREIFNVGPKTESKSFEFEKNVWYCLDRGAATKGMVRLPVPEVSGTYGVDPKLDPTAPGG